MQRLQRASRRALGRRRRSSRTYSSSSSSNSRLVRDLSPLFKRHCHVLHYTCTYAHICVYYYSVRPTNGTCRLHCSCDAFCICIYVLYILFYRTSHPPLRTVDVYNIIIIIIIYKCARIFATVVVAVGNRDHSTPRNNIKCSRRLAVRTAYVGRCIKYCHITVRYYCRHGIITKPVFVVIGWLEGANRICRYYYYYCRCCRCCKLSRLILIIMTVRRCPLDNARA